MHLRPFRQRSRALGRRDLRRELQSTWEFWSPIVEKNRQCRSEVCRGAAPRRRDQVSSKYTGLEGPNSCEAASPCADLAEVWGSSGWCAGRDPAMVCSGFLRCWRYARRGADGANALRPDLRLKRLLRRGPRGRNSVLSARDRRLQRLPGLAATRTHDLGLGAREAGAASGAGGARLEDRASRQQPRAGEAFRGQARRWSAYAAAAPGGRCAAQPAGGAGGAGVQHLRPLLRDGGACGASAPWCSMEGVLQRPPSQKRGSFGRSFRHEREPMAWSGSPALNFAIGPLAGRGRDPPQRRPRTAQRRRPSLPLSHPCLRGLQRSAPRLRSGLRAAPGRPPPPVDRLRRCVQRSTPRVVSRGARRALVDPRAARRGDQRRVELREPGGVDEAQRALGDRAVQGRRPLHQQLPLHRPGPGHRVPGELGHPCAQQPRRVRDLGGRLGRDAARGEEAECPRQGEGQRARSIGCGGAGDSGARVGHLAGAEAAEGRRNGEAEQQQRERSADRPRRICRGSPPGLGADSRRGCSPPGAPCAGVARPLAGAARAVADSPCRLSSPGAQETGGADRTWRVCRCIAPEGARSPRAAKRRLDGGAACPTAGEASAGGSGSIDGVSVRLRGARLGDAAPPATASAASPSSRRGAGGVVAPPTSAQR